MKLTYQEQVFIADSSYAEKDIPKRAGFIWNRIVSGKWATKSPEVACKLIEYADEAAKDALKGHAEKRQAAIESSKSTDAKIEIPSPDGLEYLPFQCAGISYCLNHSNFLIADEMGLGKTIQAIGVINADPTLKSVLVICPASLKINWKRELVKWLVRPMRVEIANGVFPTPELADIVIINYDILAKRSKDIRARQWDMILLDESHYAKNPKAQRTKEIVGDGKWNKNTRQMEYKIRPLEARRRGALTGTPILNRPIEAQPVAGWLAPREFGSFWGYAKRYCNAHQNHYGWDLSGHSNLEELQEKLRATIMVRRLKKDVLTELPAKRRQVLEIPANGAQGIVDEEAESYVQHEEELENLRVMVELSKASENPVDYEAAVAKLADRSRLAFTEMAKLRHQVALAKAPAVVDHCKETLESVNKLVVFAWHLDVIDALMDGLSEFNPVKLTGEMSQADRQASVDRFQSDETCRVFIGNIKAAGVGLTLTASSTVVFAELDWVPANLTQAEDRTHRIGQRNAVLVQHIVLDGSLDARMAKAIIKKQEVADRALDREAEAVPVVATESKGTSASRKQIEQEAATISDDEILELHAKLRFLSGMCDGARQLDGVGFNKFDARIGHELANRSCLTARQAVLGRKIVHKYRRQLEGWNETHSLEEEAETAEAETAAALEA